MSLNIEQRGVRNVTGCTQSRNSLMKQYRHALGLNIEEHDGENVRCRLRKTTMTTADILLREAARILNDLIVPP
ncbi:MAG: hypothetical protein U5P41_16220 [Gammaproteobacteria bacterium]|nr:hypothetical protein [Gammaproteobacteria bacterium]